MCDIIRKLPDDIIQYIIPFTYSIQSKELINDIKSYFYGKKMVTSIYYGIWFDSYEENADKNWLINDLFSFANDYKALMFGFTDSFYNIFTRNIMLKKNEHKVTSFIVHLENEKVDNQINIFWGIFTPEEREDFIEIANIKSIIKYNEII